MTADELLIMPDIDLRHELVRGVLIPHNLRGDQEGVVIARIGWLLGNYCSSDDVGSVSVSSGYLLERDPDTVCCPALAWVATGRVKARFAGYPEIAPDLVVEVNSPSNSNREMADRALMWLSHGTRMAVVADPRTISLTVFRPGQPPLILSEFDVFGGGDVLPGFSEPVWKFFRPRE